MRGLSFFIPQPACPFFRISECSVFPATPLPLPQRTTFCLGGSGKDSLLISLTRHAVFSGAHHRTTKASTGP